MRCVSRSAAKVNGHARRVRDHLVYECHGCTRKNIGQHLKPLRCASHGRFRLGSAEDYACRYFLRFTVRDEFGVLGKIATILGTDGDDLLIGTDGDDVIVAGGGDDSVWAGDGDDLVCLGEGDDFVNGGDGDDHIRAGDGDRADGRAGFRGVSSLCDRCHARGDRHAARRAVGGL